MQPRRVAALGDDRAAVIVQERAARTSRENAFRESPGGCDHSPVDQGIVVTGQIRSDAVERIARNGDSARVGDPALVVHEDAIDIDDVDRCTGQNIHGDVGTTVRRPDPGRVRDGRRACSRLPGCRIMVVASGMGGTAGDQSGAASH
jgi:hypothetical protein